MSRTPVIAFNTANLVARHTEWKFELKNWGAQHTLTVERTNESEWASICREIAAAGYRAIEIWLAHVDPAGMTDARARTYRQIMADTGLTPIGLAGPLTVETARVCQQLGIPACNGGLWGTDLPSVERLTRETLIAFNYENHPEKSIDEIRERIAGGTDRIGVALDTGWLGTQRVHAPDAVRKLGPLIRHVHLKDVATPGEHDTCALGEGVVDVAGVIRELKSIGYAGVLSWEDEPEARNPMSIAGAMRTWIEQTWNNA